MKKITIVLVFLLAFGCKSIYERAPQMRSFGCELPPIVFLEKINGLSQLEGFFVAELDTNNNNCLLVLQKNLTIKGSANDREIVADQIRFRYSQLDKTVWYSTGIFKSYKGIPPQEVPHGLPGKRRGSQPRDSLSGGPGGVLFHLHGRRLRGLFASAVPGERS